MEYLKSKRFWILIFGWLIVLPFPFISGWQIFGGFHLIIQRAYEIVRYSGTDEIYDGLYTFQTDFYVIMLVIEALILGTLTEIALRKLPSRTQRHKK